MLRLLSPIPVTPFDAEPGETPRPNGNNGSRPSRPRNNDVDITQQNNQTVIFGQDGRITFLEVFLALVLGWILVALWQRVIENFAFGTLGLNRDSSLHALIVAASATVVFLVFTFTATDLSGGGRDVSEIIEEDIVAAGD